MLILINANTDTTNDNNQNKKDMDTLFDTIRVSTEVLVVLCTQELDK